MDLLTVLNWGAYGNTTEYFERERTRGIAILDVHMCTVYCVLYSRIPSERTSLEERI